MPEPQIKRKTFILRIKPNGVDRLPEALKDDDIIIGWSNADGLLDPNLEWSAFRQIIHDAYYTGADSYRSSGRVGGEMWRFIRCMDQNSLVIVPHGSDFYVAEVREDARHERLKVGEDTAYRRSVKWLNNKNPIPRHQAPAELYSRMKIRGTSADASDLTAELLQVLNRQAAGINVNFESDLQETLVQATIERLRKGFVNEREFERIIASVLQKMGADPVRVIDARQYDNGADVLATFKFGRVTEIVLAVQAKFYKPDPPVTPEWLDQLLEGMAAEGADIGWLVTTGTFSSEVEKRREELLDKNVRVDLIDAEELATLIVSNGVSSSSLQQPDSY